MDECLIYKLLDNCYQRHLKMAHHKQCENCPSDSFCPKSCATCLRRIHFPKELPQNAPTRHYDCHNMVDCYVCNFACRYASELIYPLQKQDLLARKQKLNVLSIGCGPCTDLLAIDYLKQKKIFMFDTLCYVGVDKYSDKWHVIHDYLNKRIPLRFYLVKIVMDYMPFI